MRTRPILATVPLCLVALAIACSDDDPVAVDNPCDDADVACLIVSVGTNNLQHVESYDGALNRTTHALRWDVSSEILRGFGPGKNIVVDVRFVPAIQVRYDHLSESFSLGAGLQSGAFDRWITRSTTADANGWTVAGAQSELMGESGTGAPRMSVYANFNELVSGEALRQVRLEFTVPATYDQGASAGQPILAGDLPVFAMSIVSVSSGDTTGDPPVWPADYPLPTTGP